MLGCGMSPAIFRGGVADMETSIGVSTYAAQCEIQLFRYVAIM